jgi:hypothetical protein
MVRNWVKAAGRGKMSPADTIGDSAELPMRLLQNDDRHLSFRYGECRHLSQLQTKYLSESPISVYLETVSFSRFCARWYCSVVVGNGGYGRQIHTPGRRFKTSMPTILEAQINPLAVFRGLSLVLLLTVCQPLVVIVCLRMLQKGFLLMPPTAPCSLLRPRRCRMLTADPYLLEVISEEC